MLSEAESQLYSFSLAVSVYSSVKRSSFENASLWTPSFPPRLERAVPFSLTLPSSASERPAAFSLALWGIKHHTGQIVEGSNSKVCLCLRKPPG